MKLHKRGDASPLGVGAMRFGPMTAVLFFVMGFGLSSILQTLGSVNMSSSAFESSFLQLYLSLGQLLPFCAGPKVVSVVQESSVNASQATLTQKVSRMEAASEQNAGALGDLTARLVAQVEGSAAGWKEALASLASQTPTRVCEVEEGEARRRRGPLDDGFPFLIGAADQGIVGSITSLISTVKELAMNRKSRPASGVEAKLAKARESDQTRKLSAEPDGTVSSEEEVDKLWEGWSSAYAVEDLHFRGTPTLSSGMLSPPHLQDCHDPHLRFLVADWWSVEVHGLGSQLHGWTILLAAALIHNRVLVLPHKYHPAGHEGCEAEGKRDSLACFFFDFVSEECRTVGLDLYARNVSVARNEQNASSELIAVGLASDARVYFISESWDHAHYWLYTEQAPSTWGKPWLKESVITLENQGKLFQADERRARVSWWRAQATKYLLRWPSSYLCRLANRERHRVYGKQVARDLLAARNRQSRILTYSSYGGLMKGELETSFWSPDELGPFMPGPCISLHVRQGDKGMEMELYDFGAFMAMAERIRRHNSSVRTIWLSTEMETVVNETRLYPSWDFMYTRGLPRVSETRGIGRGREITDQSFVNLVISVECDYFVGVPGSNWNRLIDELRRASGKRRNAHIALNMGEAR